MMKFIEIPLTKSKLFLTEKEIRSLLMSQPELYKLGLTRELYYDYNNGGWEIQF
jgi:hypothetical protein